MSIRPCLHIRIVIYTIGKPEAKWQAWSRLLYNSDRWLMAQYVKMAKWQNEGEVRLVEAQSSRSSAHEVGHSHAPKKRRENIHLRFLRVKTFVLLYLRARRKLSRRRSGPTTDFDTNPSARLI